MVRDVRSPRRRTTRAPGGSDLPTGQPAGTRRAAPYSLRQSAGSTHLTLITQPQRIWISSRPQSRAGIGCWERSAPTGPSQSPEVGRVVPSQPLCDCPPNVTPAVAALELSAAPARAALIPPHLLDVRLVRGDPAQGRLAFGAVEPQQIPAFAQPNVGPALLHSANVHCAVIFLSHIIGGHAPPRCGLTGRRHRMRRWFSSARSFALVVVTVTGLAAVTNTGLPSAVASHRAAPPVGMQLAELAGSGTVAGDWFGASVAVSSSTIVVGAPTAPLLPSGVGRAYVFAKTATGWHQSAELEGPDALGPDWLRRLGRRLGQHNRGRRFRACIGGRPCVPVHTGLQRLAPGGRAVRLWHRPWRRLRRFGRRRGQNSRGWRRACRLRGGPGVRVHQEGHRLAPERPTGRLHGRQGRLRRLGRRVGGHCRRRHFSSSP